MMKTNIEMNEEICSLIKTNSLDIEINRHIQSIFFLSQNFPIRGAWDAFSGENFSLTESYEELNTSYDLIRLGYFKQAMISLRTGSEIGLLSIYWSIKGKNSDEFKKWIASNSKTPFKKEVFKTLKLNDNIRKFELKFKLFEDIKKLGVLSDYVHTNGIIFSNYGKTNQMLKGKTPQAIFLMWLDNLRQIVKVLEILHLLKFPAMNLRYSGDYLLSKFGTFDKVPFFGGGLPKEINVIGHLISIKQKEYIEELANEDEEVKYIINWLDELPILSPTELKGKIIESAKQNIEMSGFENWVAHQQPFDMRITDEIVSELREWSNKNEYLTFEQILKKSMPQESVDSISKSYK